MPSGNGKDVDSPLNQSRPGNESSEPSPQSPSGITQPSRLRRTLLFAGVFALLAMLFVPTPEQHGHRAGYRWVFDRSDTSIAFFQLLVNVAFAALMGALLANFLGRLVYLFRALARALLALLRRLAWPLAACFVIAAIGFGLLWTQEAATVRARSDERYADYLIGTVHDGVRAKDYLLRAAENWKLAGDTAKGQSARQRADNAYQEAAAAREAAAEQAKKQAAVLRAQRDEDRATELLHLQWRDNAPYPPTNEKVAKAKQLLLDAAEAWHIAGNTDREQRVRAVEKSARYLPAGPLSAKNFLDWPDEPPWVKYQRIDRGARFSIDPRDIDDAISRARAHYNGAVERGDLGAMKVAEAELSALGVNAWEEFLLAKKRKQDDEDCRKEMHLQKWDHWTDAGKTFMLGTFFERQLDTRTVLKDYL
jgi:hypothetical protein